MKRNYKFDKSPVWPILQIIEPAPLISVFFKPSLMRLRHEKTQLIRNKHELLIEIDHYSNIIY